MIFLHNIKSNAQLCSTNVENKYSGEIRPVLAVFTWKVVIFCVIYNGDFNLRSKYKENGTQ
jgi:hypothetical protein